VSFQLGRTPGFDLLGKIPVPTIAIDHPRDAEHHAHENQVVDVPISVIHPKLEQFLWHVLDVRDPVRDKGEAEKDNGVLYIAPLLFDPVESARNNG
jgi:hypothetical protein